MHALLKNNNKKKKEIYNNIFYVQLFELSKKIQTLQFSSLYLLSLKKKLKCRESHKHIKIAHDRSTGISSLCPPMHTYLVSKN